jgi:hypothetical protein
MAAEKRNTKKGTMQRKNENWKEKLKDEQRSGDNQAARAKVASLECENKQLDGEKQQAIRDAHEAIKQWSEPAGGDRG